MSQHRHIVVHRAGGYEALTIEPLEVRAPGADEVAIDVETVGVNFADCIVRMGLYASAKKYVGWPITPGFEVAGTVSAVGADVTHVSVGDSVIGLTRFDGYATHLVVPSGQVFRRPSSLTIEEAAGFPTVFLTAWFALFELAHPRAGQRMLVHSAAGGVGSALVQLGRVAGCNVTGVVGRSAKREVAERQGAHHVIDKSRQDLWASAEAIAPEGFHVILDANGVETLGQSYKHLAAPGKLVVYGFHTMFERGGKTGTPAWLKLAAGWLRTPRFNPLDMTTDNRSVMAFNLSYLFDEQSILAESMHDLLGWLEGGQIRPLPVTTFDFDDVAGAHRALESGTTVGKLVLRV